MFIICSIEECLSVKLTSKLPVNLTNWHSIEQFFVMDWFWSLTNHLIIASQDHRNADVVISIGITDGAHVICLISPVFHFGIKISIGSSIVDLVKNKMKKIIFMNSISCWWFETIVFKLKLMKSKRYFNLPPTIWEKETGN